MSSGLKDQAYKKSPRTEWFGNTGVAMNFAKVLGKLAGIALLSSSATWHTSVNANSVAEEIYNVSIVERQRISNTHQVLTLSLGTRTQEVTVTSNPAFDDLSIVDQYGRVTHSRTEAYIGTLDNLPQSWARLTVTGQAVDGIIDTGSSRIFISSEPPPSDIDPINLTTRHRRQIQQFSSTADKILLPPPPRNANRQAREVVQIPVGNGFPDTGNQQVTRVARIAIVVDSFYDEALGGRGLAQAISTINTVDGIYQQEFGLALKADSAIMITDEETLDLGHVSLEENLARFRTYRQSAPELPAHLALVHLFTGVLTEDPSVGLAYIGAACRDDGYDVSMSTPFQFPVLLTAHEIGHNLSAPHDDETDLCHLTEELLMHSQISDVTTEAFSICSANAINTHLEQSTCYLAAIDLSLTLTRDENQGLLAVVTNTDTQRAFPSARLSISLKNASIASAPASCEIESTTEVICVIPTTLPEDNHSLAFEVRYDDTLENTIDATLEAVDFIDIKTINNYAQIVLPAIEQNDDTHTIAGNDQTTAPPAGTVAGADAPSTDTGGGSLDIWLLMSLILSLTTIAITRKEPATNFRVRNAFAKTI